MRYNNEPKLKNPLEIRNRTNKDGRNVKYEHKQLKILQKKLDTFPEKHENHNENIRVRELASAHDSTRETSLLQNHLSSISLLLLVIFPLGFLQFHRSPSTLSFDL